MVPQLHQCVPLAGAARAPTLGRCTVVIAFQMNTLPPGLIAAPFTAFHPDTSLNLEAVPRLAALLARNRVVGAFVCGTTGEGLSMTVSERRRVAEAWKAALPAELKLIVHVGCLNLGETCELARHAQMIGADAIGTMAPSFFKPAAVEDLVQWTAHVAAAAPRLPFYYYHIPSMTGVRIAAADYLAQARLRIPNLAGIKFTDEDLADYSAARAMAGEKHQILFGRDELLLSGLDCGATGAVGSTYNYSAPLYLRIMQALKNGDRAEAERGQADAREFIDVMIRHGGLPAGKAIMKMIGVDCGPVRLPLRSLTASAEQALRADLESKRFFAHASAA